MKFLVPQGIGDSVWTLFKVQSIAKACNANTIEICPGVYHLNKLEDRACAFLNRFSFVDKAEVVKLPRLGGSPVLNPGHGINAKGRYDYWADGPTGLPGVDWVAIANRALEDGNRLEQWLPDYEIDWNIFDRYRLTGEEEKKADEFRAAQERPFVAFFMGSDESNTPPGTKKASGHNRDRLWTPEEWAALGDLLVERYYVNIVVVGAAYDAGFFTAVAPHIRHREAWKNRIGHWPINQTFAILKHAKALVSFQCGVGIVSHYLGVPTAMWWRPEGNSIASDFYLSVDERMNNAWTYPDATNYFPMVYTKHGVEQIMAWIHPYVDEVDPEWI